MAATETFDARIDLQISSTDKAALIAAAKRDGRDLSTWLRRLALREASKKGSRVSR